MNEPADLAFSIRPAVPERDFADIARIVTEDAGYPTTAAEMHEWEARQWPGLIRHRLVAEAEGAVVGYGLSAHQSWDRPGRFEVWVVVTKAWRGKGIGAALHDATISCARENGATLLTSEVREGEDASLRFAEQRGYRISRRQFQSQLDVDAFDMDRFAGTVERLEASGIRLFSLAEVDTPEVRRGLYEVNKATAYDIPGNEGEFSTPEEFEQMVYAASWYIPDGQIMAADGDRIVGMTALGHYPEKGYVYNNMTGVLREYRGRGIALALKLRAIDVARARGMRTMRTDNDSENAPMLAINRKLGYRPEPGIIRLMREVTPRETRG